MSLSKFEFLVISCVCTHLLSRLLLSNRREFCRSFVSVPLVLSFLSHEKFVYSLHYKFLHPCHLTCLQNRKKKVMSAMAEVRVLVTGGTGLVGKVQFYFVSIVVFK